MAICKSYENLTPVEKVIFIGKVVHCLQSDNYTFENIDYLIKKAERNGVLDGVKILPDNGKEEETT